ncbi:MAG: hypothetical protein D6694_14700 [Gammaproteobacteria bacterium]|nr:MAG: hypothetical protein D6694_14700 [Gammaproteobacteria bacterium]
MHTAWSCALLFCAMLASSATGAEPRDQAAAKQQLEELRRAIRATRRTLQANQARYSKAVLALQTAEKKVGQSVRALRQLTEKLTQTETKIKTLENRQAELELKKKQQQSALAAQLRAAYAMGEQEYIKILLSLDDPHALTQSLTYFKYLTKARKQQIQALRDTLTELARIKQTIEQERNALRSLVEQKRREQARLVQHKLEQEKAVANWKANVERAETKLQRLLANEKELQALIEKLHQMIEVFMPGQSLVGLDRLRGKLRWPVQGRLAARFGQKRPFGALRWQGVLLDTKEGQAVHAISAGRVVFADWLRGYGLLIIIDHGKNDLSLYGHNQTILKQVGDWVEPGEVIALAGKTGGLSTPALYFEIRRNNTPVNPAIWCR